MRNNAYIHTHADIYTHTHTTCITLATGLTTRQYGRPWVHGELVCAACGWGRCCWHEGVTNPSYNHHGHRTGHYRPWSDPTWCDWMQTPYCAWMTPIESLQPEGGRDTRKSRHYSEQNMRIIYNICKDCDQNYSIHWHTNFFFFFWLPVPCHGQNDLSHSKVHQYFCEVTLNII